MNDLICIRGGGDLATGIIQKFWRSGFRVFVLDISKPTCIRRSVSLSSAVAHGRFTVEDVTAQRVDSADDFALTWQQQVVPVLVDPSGSCLRQVKPSAVIDAIIAKKNLGTIKAMAPITIALGPGFKAPDDVDAVIETMRGHDLGRLILSGCALPNTGIPGEIAGRKKERVIHAPVAGDIQVLCDIGSVVSPGQIICRIGQTEVKASIGGLVRGMIQPGTLVSQGLKIADIDPRTDIDWQTISDKARCLGGAALEAFMLLKARQANRGVL